MIEGHGTIARRRMGDLLQGMSGTVVRSSGHDCKQSNKQVTGGFARFVSFIHDGNVKTFIRRMDPKVSFTSLDMGSMLLLVGGRVSGPGPSRSRSALSSLTTEVTFRGLITIVFSRVRAMPSLRSLLEGTARGRLST